MSESPSKPNPEVTPADHLTSRAVRSFVVRNGRMTTAQQRALDELLPVYGVEFSDIPVVPEQHYPDSQPLWVEVGFGNGDAMLSIAGQFPDVNYLGIEVHAPGVGHALAGIQSNGLENVRVIRHDAFEVLASLPAASISRLLVFFPDPWPKKRHHKRRILQQEFLDIASGALTADGVIHCATDWQEYAEAMMEVLDQQTWLKNSAGAGEYANKPDYRPATRFEQRGRRLGHQVFDLVHQHIGT